MWSPPVTHACTVLASETQQVFMTCSQEVLRTWISGHRLSWLLHTQHPSVSPNKYLHISSTQAMNISLQILFNLSSYHLRAVPWLRQLPDSHHGGPGSIPGHSTWDNWWTKWYWGKFFYEYFSFPLSVSLHQCPIFIHSSSTDITHNLSNWQHL
jgi:hypothetical protein